MSAEHKELAAGGWTAFSLCEQMANIGSEVERTISWRKKHNSEYSQRAFDRALELIDLTLRDTKNIDRLSEVSRVREVLADFVVFDNSYGSTDEDWQKYFLAFAFAARNKINVSISN